MDRWQLRRLLSTRRDDSHGTALARAGSAHLLVRSRVWASPSLPDGRRSRFGTALGPGDQRRIGPSLKLHCFKRYPSARRLTEPESILWKTPLSVLHGR